ncbi:MAG TPA: SusE domain-containing protein [Flavisolibacter sp.]|nr:SusE domain-containing protein [Flavisolibacter sp.]
MKNLIKFFLIILGSAFFFSCEKKLSEVTYEGGTEPVLSANRTTTIPLSFATKDDQAIALSWTNPDYKFSTGPSSHDVAYLVEIDTTGANFTNPARKSIGVARDLSLSLTQDQLNGYLLNDLNLVPGMVHNIEIRVTASLGTNSALPLRSNVLKYTVTPYAIPPKVTPPASGKLFVTGSATPGNWMGGGDPELASQRFTQVTPTLYVLNSIALNGGQSFLFVPVYGDWNNKYGFTGNGNENNVVSDDFRAGGNDIKAPAVSGNYKIEVDFQRGKFTVTKL